MVSYKWILGKSLLCFGVKFNISWSKIMFDEKQFQYGIWHEFNGGFWFVMLFCLLMSQFWVAKVRALIRRRAFVTQYSPFCFNFTELLNPRPDSSCSTCLNLYGLIVWLVYFINFNSYTPRTLRACCSQSKFRILKIRESSARALFLYNCTPNISRSADASVSVA